MNNAFWARVLLALLFVYAGYGKLMNFTGFVDNALTPKFAALSTVVGILVVIIEIVVAIAFVVDYKRKWATRILIGFTALVTILYHNPWAGGTFDGNMMVMALKNLAIIGGFWATLQELHHHKAHHA